MNALLQPVLQPLAALGWRIIGTLEVVGGLGLLLARAAQRTPRALFLGRGKRLGWRNLFFQMVRVGVRSVGIVSVVLAAIGAILALQIAPVLEQFGAVGEVDRIIAIAVVRELGPLVAAIVLTGFAGASIAAELGTMVVGEEVEALETHAIDPIRFLVVPRVIATTVMTVCLAVVGDVMGLAGGLVVSTALLDASWQVYVEDTFAAIDLTDFFTGLLKAMVFGLIIGGLACHLGLSVRGGAEGVGNATTRSVVLTIVFLIVVDLIFTGVFFAIDL
ncbi:MAG: MlaE family ABC transporter permease [Phycisphaerae bacterium]